MTSRSITGAFALGACLVAGSTAAFAASHREAPLIAFDPAADNTDTYAFVSYGEDNVNRPPEDRRVTFVMNVSPGQDPADGPNYFAFDDKVLYRFHIDNNADGLAEDIVYEFRFKTETRPALGAITGPLPFIGNPNIPVSGLQGITALDGIGSEGLTRRQTYTVTEVSGGTRTELFGGQTLVAVPSNVGPATMPDYEDLAAQGIYQDGDIRVFTGQRAETFYIDLGAVFDTVNLRRFPPAMSAAEDSMDKKDPFGINRFSGFNVQTIALEVPTADLTDVATNPVIGIYASTSRRAVQQYNEDGTITGSGPWVQRSRLANALVNELLLDTPDKDRWNASEPEDEAQFQAAYQAPTVAAELELIFGLPVPATPRVDLLQLFLKYPGQTVAGDGSCGDPCAELLRLNVTVDTTPAEDQERLTVFAHRPNGLSTPDFAGFPNGRRPNDDVTDIALRVVGGPAYADNFVGDGVNHLDDAPGAGTNDGPGYGAVPGNRLDVTKTGIAKEFPFLPTPHDGRDRQHIDCGEDGANDCN